MKLIAFDTFLQAADHSVADETRFFASVTPKVISESPKQPILSSSRITWWSDEKTWLRSTDSPLRICSHCEEGNPTGEFGAILIKDLAFETSWL